jgi:AcrR family transcriptional regulator
MKKPDLMKISELARRSGFQVSTIRYYLLEGLIPVPLKTGKTRAYYSGVHLKALSLIRSKQNEQKSLSVIRKEVRKEVSFPRNARKNSELPSDKRNAVLSSSTALFLEKGYAETSIADIAQHGKMSKETIYQHFRNKEEILMACADRIFRHMYDEVWNEIRGEKNMSLRLAKRGKAFFSSYPKWISMMNLIKGLSVGDNPSFKAKFHELIQQMVKPMTKEIEQLKQNGQIRNNIDSDLAGYLVMGMAEYGAALATNENYPESYIMNSISSILNDGLLKS